MSRKYPRRQKSRSIHAHGLEQKQFKPQVIRNRRPELEDPEGLLAEIESWSLEEDALVHPEVFDDLLDTDWDL